jgi:hypothetical protein
MRLSTEIEMTDASQSLVIAGPSKLFTGRNSKPVMNIECAPGTCKTRCKKRNFDQKFEIKI